MSYESQTNYDLLNNKQMMIHHNGRSYTPRLKFKRATNVNQRHFVGFEHNENGELLFALPGGGVATERQIKGN